MPSPTSFWWTVLTNRRCQSTVDLFLGRPRQLNRSGILSRRFGLLFGVCTLLSVAVNTAPIPPSPQRKRVRPKTPLNHGPGETNWLSVGSSDGGVCATESSALEPPSAVGLWPEAVRVQALSAGVLSDPLGSGGDLDSVWSCREEVG